MYRPNNNDFKDVLSIVNLCMSYVKTGSVEIKDILNVLLRTFRSYDVVFFPSNLSLDGVDLSNTLSLNQNRKDLAKYAERYWRYDPLYPEQFGANSARPVFKTDDIIPYSKLVKLDYYQEFYRRINWFGELVIRLGSDEDFFGSISISRSPKQPHFTEIDVEKAHFLLPYLINTFETAECFSQVSRKNRVFERFFDSQSDAIMILDSDFRFVYSNSQANQIWQALSGLKIEPSNENDRRETISLPSIIIEDCKYILSKYSNTDLYTESRIIDINDNERCYVRYMIVSPGGRGKCNSNLIIRLKILPIACNYAATATLSKGYKLSAREETIAQHASLGLTNNEIAEKLYISSFTVQNHLKNIYEKTGIKNRTQLADLLK